MNKNQVMMNDIMNVLDPKEILRVAGAGNKFVNLASGNSDLYLNFVAGLKLWDTCAGDALIKSRFGVFTNAYNKHIHYDSASSTKTLQDGIIACRNPM